MLEELFLEVYDKFKLNFYKNIFKGFEDREASLTTTETFCVEVINALDKPTISELTEFMDVSQPNMTYRVTSLVDKGYVKKVQSDRDRREYNLLTTERYDRYNDIKNEYIKTVLNRTKEKFTDEEVLLLEKMLKTMSEEMMGEVTEYLNNNKKDDK